VALARRDRDVGGGRVVTPAQCLRHGPVWLASCDQCCEARRATLLATVQSCTVHTADQHLRDAIDAGAAGDLRRVPWCA
jgi:hypothetical protein